MIFRPPLRLRPLGKKTFALPRLAREAPRRSGLTLIEVLVALGLLAALVAATSAWTQITARLPASVNQPSHFRGTVLQLIHDDLSCGDWDATRESQSIDRVSIIDGKLRIKTRSPLTGSVIHEYELISITRSVAQRVVSAAGARHEARLVLSSVDSFECHIDEDRTVLTVSIITDGDHPPLTRRYALQ